MPPNPRFLCIIVTLSYYKKLCMFLNKFIEQFLNETLLLTWLFIFKNLDRLKLHILDLQMCFSATAEMLTDNADTAIVLLLDGEKSFRKIGAA